MGRNLREHSWVMGTIPPGTVISLPRNMYPVSYDKTFYVLRCDFCSMPKVNAGRSKRCYGIGPRRPYIVEENKDD